MEERLVTVKNKLGIHARPSALLVQAAAKFSAEITLAKDSLEVYFEVTDTAKNLPVVYTGILPDLFREGQGIVAQGKLRHDGVFVASEVLAKHDETYMPPEAAEAIMNAQKTQATLKE